MKLSILVAFDETGGIGRENRLPWHLPADLKRFKSLTMGHHILMGRKTWESIGRPLPGRISLVLSRDPHFLAAGAQMVHSLAEAIELARGRDETELFIIGGGEIFKQALPLAHRMYLTEVHTCVQADVFFPEFDPQEWNLLESSSFQPDERNLFAYTFKCLERKTG